MITNADMTIYSQKIDPKTKFAIYIPTQIQNVYWYTDQRMEVDQNGVHSACVYKVRIPEESVSHLNYTDFLTWNSLDDANGYWTIQKGDIVVKGLVDDEISAASDLFKKYSQVFRINTYSDNRIGGLPHFRIGGTS